MSDAVSCTTRKYNELTMLAFIGPNIAEADCKHGTQWQTLWQPGPQPNNNLNLVKYRAELVLLIQHFTLKLLCMLGINRQPPAHPQA